MEFIDLVYPGYNIYNMGQVPNCTGSENSLPDFYKNSLNKLSSEYSINTESKLFDSTFEQKHKNVQIKMQSDGFGVMYQEGLIFYLGPIQDRAAHTPQGSAVEGIIFQRYKDGNFQNSVCQYKGGFKNNQADGKGVFKNKQMTFQGKWEDGLPISGTLKLSHMESPIKIKKISLNKQFDYAKGQVQMQIQNQWVYNGEIKKINNYYQFEGQGEIKYLGEIKGHYKGEWKQGQYHGLGEYTWMNDIEQSFCGRYQWGVRNGEGIEKANKFTYKGKWKNGVKDGIFTLKKNDPNSPEMDIKIQYQDGRRVEIFD